LSVREKKKKFNLYEEKKEEREEWARFLNCGTTRSKKGEKKSSYANVVEGDAFPYLLSRRGGKGRRA